MTAPGLGERVAARLSERGESLAVAESATGGLILSLLTDVPGASGWLRGGVVAYTNEAKRDLLGVPAPVLAASGAVSAETVLEMARGVRRLFGADWAVAETGIAGPQTGRRSGKPAGLTFLAVTGAGASGGGEYTRRLLLADPGDRVATKRAFADAALSLLLEALAQ